jgi:hypothetical protein
MWSKGMSCATSSRPAALYRRTAAARNSAESDIRSQKTRRLALPAVRAVKSAVSCSAHWKCAALLGESRRGVGQRAGFQRRRFRAPGGSVLTCTMPDTTHVKWPPVEGGVRRASDECWVCSVYSTAGRNRSARRRKAQHVPGRPATRSLRQHRVMSQIGRLPSLCGSVPYPHNESLAHWNG